MGTIELFPSIMTLLTSHCITSTARLGTRHPPLICSPVYLNPWTNQGSEFCTSTNWIYRSPFPVRKTMLVSGSNKGIRIPEDTSKDRTNCGVERFLVSRRMSSRALSSPNPEVRTRSSPIQTTLLSFIPSWLEVEETRGLEERGSRIRRYRSLLWVASRPPDCCQAQHWTFKHEKVKVLRNLLV